MRWLGFGAIGFAVAVAVSAAVAQAGGVEGYWREPSGSVIHVAPCGADLCATLVAIGPQAPTRFDEKNPDPAQRRQPLCGLRIGYGFKPHGADGADGGRLYDPKSGRTYHGAMTREGASLHLRGYIGISAFGRTETWTATAAPPPCKG